MSLKTIKVNPIFLSGQNSSFTAKNKTRKEKPTGVSLNQTNNIKKKLIARIKNFQQNKEPRPNNQPGPSMTNNDAFSDSLEFLDNLARDKDEVKREKKNKTLKNKENGNAYMHIATELPPELDWNTIMPKVQAFLPQMMAGAAAPATLAPATLAPATLAPATLAPAQAAPAITTTYAPATLAPATLAPAQAAPAPVAPWQAPPQPSYSNLKTGGTKPTYRTWLRTTQKQKPVFKPTINILEDIATPLIEGEKTMDTKEVPLANASEAVVAANANVVLSEVANANVVLSEVVPAPPYVPSLKPKRKRITRTLKYKLGKHANGKVSVLIKNSQTRRKVQTEQALLKQKSILDIKNHLRSNNLLKVGSNAPSDVLRHLYEQSILAGQIENKAKDTLIHNYFNEEKK